MSNASTPVLLLFLPLLLALLVLIIVIIVMYDLSLFMLYALDETGQRRLRGVPSSVGAHRVHGSHPGQEKSSPSPKGGSKKGDPENVLLLSDLKVS